MCLFQQRNRGNQHYPAAALCYKPQTAPFVFMVNTDYSNLNLQNNPNKFYISGS